MKSKYERLEWTLITFTTDVITASVGVYDTDWGFGVNENTDTGVWEE